MDLQTRGIVNLAKTKVLISFTITAKLICVFGFAYPDCWFSHEAVQISVDLSDLGQLVCKLVSTICMISSILR